MTEAEWLAATDPTPMLTFLRGRVSERKLRLFAVACWHQVAELLLPQAWLVVALAEEHADCVVPERQRIEAVASLARKMGRVRDGRGRVFDGASVLEALTALTDTTVTGSFRVESAPQRFGPSQAMDAAEEAASGRAYREQYLSFGAVGGIRELAFRLINGPAYISYSGEFETLPKERQCVTLRDVVGNPFRTVAFDPAWRSEAAVALAAVIYAEQAFDRLPVLADALEEAGCDDADVLVHCRRPDAVHVRGCWVIDLVLGKRYRPSGK